MKRHLERSGPEGSTFWQIEVLESSCTTTWGRIGSRGQSTSEEFESEQDAIDHVGEQIHARVAEGYRLDDTSWFRTLRAYFILSQVELVACKLENYTLSELESAGVGVGARGARKISLHCTPGTHLEGLRSLSALPNLERVSIFEAPSALNLAPLAGLPSLRALEIRYTNAAIGELKGLSALTGLTSLSLRNLEGAGDFGELGALRELTTLRITEMRGCYPPINFTFAPGLRDIKMEGKRCAPLPPVTIPPGTLEFGLRGLEFEGYPQALDFTLMVQLARAQGETSAYGGFVRFP